MKLSLNMSKHLLTSRGLIIVLKSHARDYVSPGKQLFYHFQTANEVLYWNSNLYEAVHNCQLTGYILPSSLMLSGPDIFLETIKLAWSKRLLKAPKGYSLEMVGEYSGIEMRRIQQVHFIPLDEALCYIIYDLNCNNRESSFDTVVSKLAEWYRGMQLPPSELILNTLRQLMEKRQVYHTGYGYSILTTDKAAVADWLVRLPSASSHFPIEPGSPLKRSGSTSDISSLGGQGPYHSRRWSVREPLRRQRLRRFSPPPLPVHEHVPWVSEPQQPPTLPHLSPSHELPVDNNNSPAAVVETRETRGKSPSLFRKLLSLGKTKRRQDKASKTASGTGGEDCGDRSGGRQRTELAVFSGQFPPPEWLWYLSHQCGKEEAAPASHRLSSGAQYPPPTWVGTRHHRSASDEDLPSLPSPMQPLHSLQVKVGRQSRTGEERRRSHHHHHHHHHHHKHQNRSHRHRSSRHQSTGGVERLGRTGSEDMLDDQAAMMNGGKSGEGKSRKARLRQSKSMHERLHHQQQQQQQQQPSSTSGPSSVGTTPVQECSPGGGGEGGAIGGQYDDSGFHSSRNTTEGDASESKCSMLKARYHQKQQQQRPPSPTVLLPVTDGHYGSLDRALLRKHGWPPPLQQQGPAASPSGPKSPVGSSETETMNSSVSADLGPRPGTAAPQAVNNGLETVLEASTQELATRANGNRSENSIFVETDLDAAILAV